MPKRKGIAKIRLKDETTKIAELHWYEGHGKEGKKIKIKRYFGVKDDETTIFSLCQ